MSISKKGRFEVHGSRIFLKHMNAIIELEGGLIIIIKMIQFQKIVRAYFKIYRQTVQSLLCPTFNTTIWWCKNLFKTRDSKSYRCS